MLDVSVATTGPLFQQDLGQRLLAANLDAATHAAPRLAQALARAYSGGIVRRGPGRYGHLASDVRSTVQASGDSVAVRVFPSGRAAFKALFLERGTRGPHRGGHSGILLPRDRRDRAARARGHAAALKIGTLFRRSAQPHGAPAFHVAERVLAEQFPILQPLYQAAVAKAVGA